ncbi:MAG TPA: outer membrane protein transport protein [Polyangia bacterium]
MKTRAAVLLALGVALVARPSRAAGFLIYDISGSAIARASAVTADDEEPAAVWFNPANLAFMGGVSASAGGVFITDKTSFSPSGGGAEINTERGNFLLPEFFANGRLTDRVALGMGAFSTFGIGISWPDDWEAGRQAAIKASLETLTLNPTVAVLVHPRVSVAAGFDAVRSVVDFTNGLPAIIGGDVRLAGGTWGYGFNVGALYKIYPGRLHVALTYRSRVALHFDDGRAHFTPANPDFAPVLPDQGGTASITLPDIITVGVMGRPRPDLALSFDANLVLWSTYDRIDINFQSAPARAIVPNGQNAFTLRAGADWTLPGRVPGLHLRGGLIYDESAIPSGNLGPGLPDANRIDVALGAGYGRGHFRGDLGYLLVVFLPADATGGTEGPVGTYNTIAHLLALTLTATWP